MGEDKEQVVLVAHRVMSHVRSLEHGDVGLLQRFTGRSATGLEIVKDKLYST